MSALRPEQRKAIEALAKGHTVDETAVIVGRSARTIYTWRTDPIFKQALQETTDSMLAESTTFLSTCLLDAFKTMQDLCLHAENESTRLAAAKAIADSALKIKDQYEVIERIAELERLIYD